MLTADQVALYHANGYLHVPQVFPPDATDRLDAQLDRVIDTWGIESAGWQGPWRKVLMDEETERRSRLLAMDDFHLQDGTWLGALMDPRLLDLVEQLLGPVIEVHHTTMHAKLPETGQPFPMHQDSPFFQHTDARYVEALIHVDDTSPANGEIRFLPGSHRQGHLPHVLETPDGPCTPHLPTDEYRLEDTVPVPARRGDVVFFSLYTIHGSYLNRTNRVRRLVRVGYRDPENVQTGGYGLGKPGLMVRGMRPKMATEPEVLA